MSNEEYKAPPPPGMPKTYAELVRMLQPRPIHNDAELDKAHEMLVRLVGFTLNADQDDYLDALSTFVERYEDEHYPIDTSHITPIDMLKYLMEENDMTASDLGRLLGDRSIGSAILNGRRQLSKNHIRILCDRFRLDASAFLPAASPTKPRKRPAKPARSLRGTDKARKHVAR